MKAPWRNIPLVSILLLLCACNGLKPTPEILADAFFSGHAYLDANGNGEIDPDDPGLEGAMFSVTPIWGGGNSATTGEDGYAWVIIPGGLREDDWPIRVHMRPPPETSYGLVSPAEIVLEPPGRPADFLFTDVQWGG